MIPISDALVLLTVAVSTGILTGWHLFSPDATQMKPKPKNPPTVGDE